MCDKSQHPIYSTLCSTVVDLMLLVLCLVLCPMDLRAVFDLVPLILCIFLFLG